MAGAAHAPQVLEALVMWPCSSVLLSLALGKNPVSGTLLLCYVVGCLYAAPPCYEIYTREKPRVGDAYAMLRGWLLIRCSAILTSYKCYELYTRPRGLALDPGVF